MCLEWAAVRSYCRFRPWRGDAHLGGHSPPPRACLGNCRCLATHRAPFWFIWEIWGPVIPFSCGLHFVGTVRAAFWTFKFVVGPVGLVFHCRVLLCIRLELKERKQDHWLQIHFLSFWTLKAISNGFQCSLQISKSVYFVCVCWSVCWNLCFPGGHKRVIHIFLRYFF